MTILLYNNRYHHIKKDGKLELMPMLLEYRNDEVRAKVVFDDDGKTGYAYLIIDDEIVGDVWLYNVGPPPENPEWPDRDKMPFANPAGFASEERFEPINDPAEIALDWVVGSDGLRQVSVTLKGTVHALLRPGAKPGWCRLAANASPIAKPLNGAN